jgi:hypothetical protein
MKPYAICHANSSVDGRIFDAFGFDRCMWGTDWTRASNC